MIVFIFQGHRTKSFVVLRKIFRKVPIVTGEGAGLSFKQVHHTEEQELTMSAGVSQCVERQLTLSVTAPARCRKETGNVGRRLRGGDGLTMSVGIPYRGGKELHRAAGVPRGKETARCSRQGKPL
jgi:hypothetical protein